ncbi:MAG: M20 metallopeptidase family protein [Eubacterium sp.]|jgi:amidohydrolase
MKKENYERAVALRHELHMHPELSYQEVWTKQHLMDFIKAHTALEIYDRGKYFYAVYRTPDREGKRGSVAFRADFDALPMEDEIDKPYRSEIKGVGHKCGHDGHAAALCGFAAELEDLRPDRDVYLIFQHAEETGRGAEEAVEALKENPDIEEIFAFHNLPGVEEGKILVSPRTSNCASKGMSIFLKGTPTHASSPELGKNPVFALTRIVDAIPRFTDTSSHKGLVMCTVVQLDVGEYAFGVAASEGVLRMTIRGEIESEMDGLQKSLEDLARAEAEREGLDLRITYEDVFPETRNSASSVEKVFRAAKSLGYPVSEKEFSRGSEDFGWFTKIVPGAYFYIGGGKDAAAYHTSGFDFNDSIIENAVEMFKALTVEK